MAVEFWAGQGTTYSFGSDVEIYADYSTPSSWTPSQVPQPGDLAVDQAGIMVATDVGISGTTVWLDGTQYGPEVALELNGASMGPGSLLLVNGQPFTLFETINSALQGEVFVGSGNLTWAMFNTTVNQGWVGNANNAGPTSIDIVDNGSFGNSGVLESGRNSTINFTYGSATSIWSTGDLVADVGGTLDFQSGGPANTGSGTPPDFSGTLLSLGSIIANGGTVDLNVNVVQSPDATMTVTNNGTLNLAGKTDGGIIQIQSGMLNFGGGNPGPGPFSAANFDSKVAFTGSSGLLDFNQSITETFNPQLNGLNINVDWKGGQDGLFIPLSGSYSADQFAVSGNQVIYTAHPTSTS